jgi:hypothetical protein
MKTDLPSYHIKRKKEGLLIPPCPKKDFDFYLQVFKPGIDESRPLTKLPGPNNIQHNDPTCGYIL